MSEETITINGLDLDAIIDELEQWFSFLNTVIGIMSFTLALACLGTNTPAFNALLSVIIVILAVEQQKRFYLEKVRKLRKSAKKNETADLILEGFESRHLSTIKIMLRLPMYWLGFGLLICIMISPQVFNGHPLLIEYFNL
ncbi:hypothetical protein [Endozoicomonas numazuensis]|uniref:hypothetical protein n=1 Tax=Endozoicomonas numazuensis TaxID=1137799 RepID=UPI0012694847|nr:hypothetical protein [Endozoicomonas numazuensis]